MSKSYLMPKKPGRLTPYPHKLAQILCKNTIMIYLKIMAMQILLLLAPAAMAQSPQVPEMLSFGPDFRFNDGIYANFDMVKANCPIPPARVVTKQEFGNHDFYKKVLSEESLVLYDDQGVRVMVERRKIWGYAYMGTMYLQIGGHFHRLLSEGMLSRFIASATIREELNPRSSRSEGYLPYSSSYNHHIPFYFEVAKKKEVLLLDFEDNLMTAYSPEALLEKLEKDSVLYREYESLGMHKRKKRMLEYVQRYNQRHPYYLPSGCKD
jgi:hypothetical protein